MMFCNYKKVLLSLVYCVLTTLLFAQGKAQTVTITSTGAGSNAAEAKQAALRDALEQAFGAFITTNTEILNDQIVKDELSSVASGNIQDYSVLNETQLSDGQWAATVRATVSVSKLISYAQSKGMQVSFKGSLFALNIQQKLLNEQGEVRAMENMIKILKNTANSSFDYSIQAGDPISAKGTEKFCLYLKNRFKKESELATCSNLETMVAPEVYWSIPLVISVSANENFENIPKCIYKTLHGLSLSEKDKGEYEKLGIATFPVNFQTWSIDTVASQLQLIDGSKLKTINKSETYSIFYLRNEESQKLIASFIMSLRSNILGFTINDGLSQNKYSYYSNFELIQDNFHPIILRCPGEKWNASLIKEKRDIWAREQSLISDYGGCKTHYDGKAFFDGDIEDGLQTIFHKFPYNKGIYLQFTELFDNNKVTAVFKLNDFKTTDQIKNITGYEITNSQGRSTPSTKPENKYANPITTSSANTEKKKGMLGVKIIELNPTVINDINQNIKVKEKPFDNELKGLYINEVIAGGAAADIGLKTGDVIIGLNNEDDFTSNNHFEKMKALMAGDEITLKIIRWQGGIESVKLKLK